MQENNTPSPLEGEGRGEGLNTAGQVPPDNKQNPENQLSNLPQNLPQQPDMETILNLVKLVYQYAIEKGGKSTELDKLVEQMESILEEK